MKKLFLLPTLLILLASSGFASTLIYKGKLTVKTAFDVVGTKEITIPQRFSEIRIAIDRDPPVYEKRSETPLFNVWVLTGAGEDVIHLSREKDILESFTTIISTPPNLIFLSVGGAPGTYTLFVWGS